MHRGQQRQLIPQGVAHALHHIDLIDDELRLTMKGLEPLPIRRAANIAIGHQRFVHDLEHIQLNASGQRQMRLHRRIAHVLLRGKMEPKTRRDLINLLSKNCPLYTCHIHHSLTSVVIVIFTHIIFGNTSDVNRDMLISCVIFFSFFVEDLCIPYIPY